MTVEKTTTRRTIEMIYRKENYKDQRYKRKDYHEDKCEDGYISDYDDSFGDRYDKGRISYKNRGRRISYKNSGRNRDKYQNKNRKMYQNKDQCRNDSYVRNRSRSRERSHLPKARKGDKSEIEEVHKVIQQLSRDKQIALKLILDNSEDFEAMFYSIHSEADVDHLIQKELSMVEIRRIHM